ncbi:hypothetical protein PRUPE_6G055000 [Prunus persica]|uniref:NADH:ubiquinone oxidoreductase intermediate-associated protein 30 domain-containing protein n=1 Tax=Prunus persica TaxID=3760 RepID=A0A251NKQ1_PRUPE|nr:hypothetical protein PRUPE_6G055000 [Prunus persica]
MSYDLQECERCLISSTKDSVMVVTKDEYEKCHSAHPIFFSNNGLTVFTLDRPGPNPVSDMLLYASDTYRSQRIQSLMHGQLVFRGFKRENKEERSFNCCWLKNSKSLPASIKMETYFMSQDLWDTVDSGFNNPENPTVEQLSVVAPIVMGTLIFQASLAITSPYTLLEQRNSFRRWVWLATLQKFTVSKGGVDAAAALSIYWCDLKDKVAGLALVQSPYGGTPLASDILRERQIVDEETRRIMELLICKLIKASVEHNAWELKQYIEEFYWESGKRVMLLGKARKRFFKLHLSVHLSLLIVRTSRDWDTVGYTSGFDTVCVPFSSLKPIFQARTVSDAPPFDPSNIVSLQLMFSKFEFDGKLNPTFVEGAFKLPLSSIRAYLKEPITPRFVHLGSAGATRPDRPGLDLSKQPPAVRLNKELDFILTFKLKVSY